MGKKKSPAFDKIENKQSRLGTFLKKRNGLFKKTKEFSTGLSIAGTGSSTITAESPSIDSMLDEFLSNAVVYPSIDSLLDEFLSNVVGSPCIDTRVDDFISDTTGYPSIDSTVATTTAAMSEFDLEAWDDLEELLALRRWTKSLGRGRG